MAMIDAVGKVKITTRNVYGEEFEAEAGKLALSVHVYGVAVRDGKILISPQFDGYDFPGGTVELGETLAESLVREIYEETGLKAKPVKLLNIYTSFFHHHKTGKDYQTYLIYYLVDVEDGEITAAGFDEDEKEYAKMARWVTIDELNDMRHASSNNIDVARELLQMVEGEDREKNE